jgi:hypothetical protein
MAGWVIAADQSAPEKPGSQLYLVSSEPAQFPGGVSLEWWEVCDVDARAGF